ncbi:RTA1 domain protein [Aspergillus luchuensis]|nr:RTA1 domain protein [Aspergillus luchuensis IFO 4308]GAT21311.1 RTA1 domain protein [Aspergillus luchuensis]
MSTWNCHSFDPEVAPLLGYRPSLTAGILFTIAFLGVLTTHVSQACNTIYPWIGLVLSLGAALEFIGWLARTLAYRCPYNSTIWEIQLSALMFAPYFTTVGIYGVLDLMYAIINQVRLPFRPKRWAFTCIFIALLSLILQVIGGSLAHKASSVDNSISLGIKVLYAGSLLQLASLSIFAVLFKCLIVSTKDRLIWRMPMIKMIGVLPFALLCLMVRDTYRAVESPNGWRGYSFTYEVLGCLFDGLPMFIVNVTLSIWHPAVLLNEARLMEATVARAEEVGLRSMEDQNGRGSHLLDEYRPVPEELEPALRKR